MSHNAGMALNYVSDLARVGQYLRVPVHAGRVWRVLREDASILEQLRRGLLPLPTDQPAGAPDEVFPPARHGEAPVWEGRRVGVVATGGSGALASVVGVARALEEAGVTPSAYGLCSGSAMFGIPLAAGMSTDEVARAMLAMRPADYLDPDWRHLAAAPLRLGQGWAGLLRGEAIEGFFRDLLGDRTLGDLSTPVWFPVWSVERNRLRYVSSIDDPELSAARAVRMAVALPLAFEPVAYQGESYLDGGIVEILPARPFSRGDICDVAVVINGFYRPGFVADEDPRWRDEPFSLIRISAQTRLMGHIDTARRSLADLDAAADVHVLHPVPYGTVQSAGLYTEFVDRRAWSDYMRSGYEHTVAMLDEVATAASHIDEERGTSPRRR